MIQQKRGINQVEQMIYNIKHLEELSKQSKSTAQKVAYNTDIRKLEEELKDLGVDYGMLNI